MSIISLNGLQTKKANIKTSSQAIILENVAIGATVKVTVQREGMDDVKPIPSMTVGKALEMQGKMRSLLSGKEFVIETIDAPNDAAGTTEVVPYSLLHLGLDGEITLNDNDAIIVEFTSGLGQVTANCNILPLEGKRVASKIADLKKVVYQASKDEKEIHLNNVDFLGFDVIPQEISVFYDNEIRRIDSATLKAINYDNFGHVHQKGSAGSFGMKYIYVLNVADATKCVIKDEVQANDFNIYTSNVFN